MVGLSSDFRVPFSFVGAVVVVAVLGAGLYWTRDQTAGSQAALVNVDFDVDNGELGDVQTEVRVNDGAAQTFTASCKETGAGKPNVCRVRLPLAAGRHRVSVRTLTPRGWTMWSEPATLEIK